MYRDQSRRWVKHLDFMVIDVMCMQLCFVLSYWAWISFSNPYQYPVYQYQASLFIVGQLLVMLFTDNYRGILRRGNAQEAIAVLRYVGAIFVVAIMYLFIVHQSMLASRMQFGLTFVFFLVLDYIARWANKKRIRSLDLDKKKSYALITSSDLVPRALERLTDESEYRDFFISEIILLDARSSTLLPDYGIPVMGLSADSIRNLSHDWVDEVLIIQPESTTLPPRLMDDLQEMGMTVNYASMAMGADRWPVTEVRDIGGYQVLTSSIQMAPAGQVLVKRLMDIVGGLVGSIITIVLMLFVGPAIYVKSPGPIFFRQERVGRNGKTFRMFKFRSMYMDAEERKAELMAQNKVEDGMMFKMDDDPRIIGSERKDAEGRPRGIGNFIRRTSIDEFPQFFNVLKGDMSLVGTRPPTLDEWEKYDLGHRVRMSIKPGITGLWQVSGRSAITDFREVVRLDREYIDNWNIALDLKILWKTVGVVLKGRGAE